MRYSRFCLSLVTASVLTLAGCHSQGPANAAPSNATQPRPAAPGGIQPITTASAKDTSTPTSPDGNMTTNRATASTKPAAVSQSQDKITLNLGMPANVRVYQGDALFQQQKYTKPGTYVIDASQWPNGVYQVVVQSGGGLSQVVVRQSFTFTKPGTMTANLSINN